MNDLSELVECAEHGMAQRTYVCQHVARGSGLGFFYFPNPDNPRPDAWCAECNAVRLASNGWNEENEKAAAITLLCGGCYDDAKARNQQ